MESQFIYGFLVGLNVGRINGFISSLAVSGVTLYIYDPTIYQYETLALAANTTLNAIETLKSFHL